jgi:resuscitation-promoting factor RpfA
MNKSPDAFRTISEVADFLETPAHVLRFWESRFPQIKPVKRAGGRRYYRPADIALLIGIKRLLHDDGMTIRGVQKILREQGVRFVSGMDDTSEADDEAALAAALAQAVGTPDPSPSLPLAEVETAQIIALQAALRSPVENGETVSKSPPEPVTQDPADDEQDGARDVPVAWQIDTVAEDESAQEASDLSPPVAADFDRTDTTRADVSAPPPPVTTSPVGPSPVVADLFGRAAPPSTPDPKPLPEPEADEAPMAVWADESDLPANSAADVAAATDLPTPPAPALKITRIGAALRPAVVAEQPVALSGPTLAQRLRARSPQSLTEAECKQLAEIRGRAIALHRRLTGPARIQG